MYPRDDRANVSHEQVRGDDSSDKAAVRDATTAVWARGLVGDDVLAFIEGVGCEALLALGAGAGAGGAAKGKGTGTALTRALEGGWLALIWGPS